MHYHFYKLCVIQLTPTHLFLWFPFLNVKAAHHCKIPTRALPVLQNLYRYNMDRNLRLVWFHRAHLHSCVMMWMILAALWIRQHRFCCLTSLSKTDCSNCCESRSLTNAETLKTAQVMWGCVCRFCTVDCFHHPAWRWHALLCDFFFYRIQKTHSETFNKHLTFSFSEHFRTVCVNFWRL